MPRGSVAQEVDVYELAKLLLSPSGTIFGSDYLNLDIGIASSLTTLA